MTKIHIRDFFGDKAFYKQIISISLPIMAQQFVTSFVNLIDNVMVGGVGQAALTSVTVANRFYMIASSILFGLTGAAGIFISQNYGAGKHERCQKILNINLSMSILIMTAFMSVLFVAPEWTVHLFSKTPEIVELSLDYIVFAKYTYIPYAISMSVMMSMRAIGMNKIQLKIGIATVLTNTVLNYILIYGKLGAPAMGVKGAALATMVARLLEMTIYLVLLIRQKHYYRLDLKGLVLLDWGMMKAMVSKAIPLTANELFFSVGMSLIFKSYMRCDELLVAAISVVDTVMNLAFIVFGGLSSAIAIFIGGKLGAGKLDEAKGDAKKIIVFGMIVSMALGSILFLVAPFIHHLYELSPEAIHALETLVRIKSILMPIYVINVCTFFILRAGGAAMSTMIIDSGFLWAGPVLVSTVLSLFTSMDLVTLYITVELLDLVKMFFAFWFLGQGKWVRNLAED